MSLIHLEKSVLTFHLKEILEEGQGSHPLTWLGLGLLIFAPKLIPTQTQSIPSMASPAVKSKRTPRNTPIRLSDWIAEARKRELEAQMYAVLEEHITRSS